MIWKCLIVDDEPPAQRVIEKFIQDIPGVQIVGKCKNAFEAANSLQKNDVDIMFLDINMPKMSGLSFVKTINRPPLIIITTAYREYAMDCFELDILDYLKKPFSFERFFKAVNKAIDILCSEQYKSNSHDRGGISTSLDSDFLFVREDKISYKIDLSDILYIESVGDYNKVYTISRVYITYQTLKKIEDLLPNNLFPRIHKSFIIALAKVNSIMGNQVKINDALIPVGQTYRKEFMALIDKYQ